MHYFSPVLTRMRQQLLCVWGLLLATIAGVVAQTTPRAYYSSCLSGAIVPTSPTLMGGGNVVPGPSGAEIAASLTTDITNPVMPRLPVVGGPAPAGYRVGMLRQCNQHGRVSAGCYRPAHLLEWGTARKPRSKRRAASQFA